MCVGHACGMFLHMLAHVRGGKDMETFDHFMRCERYQGSEGGYHYPLLGDNHVPLLVHIGANTYAPTPPYCAWNFGIC